MRSQTSRMKTDHSICTSAISKPWRATGTPSKLASSRPQDRAPIWLATCCGLELWSPRKLPQHTNLSQPAACSQGPSGADSLQAPGQGPLWLTTCWGRELWSPQKLQQHPLILSHVLAALARTGMYGVHHMGPIWLAICLGMSSAVSCAAQQTFACCLIGISGAQLCWSARVQPYTAEILGWSCAEGETAAGLCVCQCGLLLEVWPPQIGCQHLQAKIPAKSHTGTC